MSVKHPSYYNNFKSIAEDGTATFEPIKVMRHLYLDYGYYMTSIIKYLARGPHKGQQLSDYRKAAFCIEKIKENYTMSRPDDERVKYIKEACDDWSIPSEIQNVFPDVWMGKYDEALKSLNDYISLLEQKDEVNND